MWHDSQGECKKEYHTGILCMGRTYFRNYAKTWVSVDKVRDMLTESSWGWDDSLFLFVPLFTSFFLFIPLHTSLYLFIPLYTSLYRVPWQPAYFRKTRKHGWVKQELYIYIGENVSKYK